MLPTQRARERSGTAERGFTLLEVVISLMVIGLLVGVMTGGIMTTLRVSSEGNQLARTNALLTRFEETLAQLEYRDCGEGDLVELYWQAFDLHDQGLAVQHQVQGDNITAEIVSVESGCVSGTEDSGEQTLKVQLTFGDTTRTGAVTKRTDLPPDGPRANFVWTPLSPGQPVANIQFDASTSSPLSGEKIIEYRYDCGDDPPTVITTAQYDDPDAICSYVATSAPQTFNVTLTVTDTESRVHSKTKPITIDGATDPLGPVTAVIDATCPQADCPGGQIPHNGSFPVAFSAAGSTAPENDPIISYDWNFGDINSGSANTASGVSTSHAYASPGTFTVTLTITTQAQRTVSTTKTMTMTSTNPVPTASFTMSSGSTVISPQLVTLDGSASSAASGRTIVEWFWEFGDGSASLQTNDDPVDFTYQFSPAFPGPQESFDIKLTVTDDFGNEATQIQTITLSELDIANFSLTDAEGSRLYFWGWDPGRFYFSWSNVPRSPNDQIRVRIEADAEPYDLFDPCTWADIWSGGATSGWFPSNGAAGTTVTATFQPSWQHAIAMNVCRNFRFRYQVERTWPTATGQQQVVTNWSAWTGWNEITHT